MVWEWKLVWDLKRYQKPHGTPLKIHSIKILPRTLHKVHLNFIKFIWFLCIWKCLLSLELLIQLFNSLIDDWHLHCLIFLKFELDWALIDISIVPLLHNCYNNWHWWLMFVRVEKLFDWQFATIETTILLSRIESIESLFLLFFSDYQLLCYLNSN